MNLRENAYDSWSSVDLSGVCESYTFFTPSCAYFTVPIAILYFTVKYTALGTARLPPALVLT